MKSTKQLLFTIFTLCVLSISVLGGSVNVNAASNTSLMTNYLKNFKKGNYKKAATYIKKMKSSDKDTSLKKMSKKQKAAYKKIVKKYGNSFSSTKLGKEYLWGYYLADLNKDKKAELLIKYGSCEADVITYIYTYKKGKAKKVATIGSGHTGYIAYPGKGVVQAWGHMGYCAVSVLTMKGNKIRTKSYGGQDNSKTYSDYCLPENYLYSHIKYDSHYKSSIDYSDLK